jgi:AbrB family looped-hinge helix DNA binding protein
MWATGIIRRIDDLGRVVIPKEIRRRCNIREGDPLEIYTTNDGAVMFKKYSPDNTNEVAKYIVSTLRALGYEVGVYDGYGDHLEGSRVGSDCNKIDIDSKDLVKVSDDGFCGRCFLYINVVSYPSGMSNESVNAVAKMAYIMLN